MSAYLKTFGDTLIIDPDRIMAITRKELEAGELVDNSPASSGATILFDNGAAIDACQKAADELFAFLSKTQPGESCSASSPSGTSAIQAR